MLDEVNELVQTLRLFLSLFRRGNSSAVCGGDMYCPKCGGPRRMFIRMIYTPPRDELHAVGPSSGLPGAPFDGLNLAADILQQITPSLLSFACMQCDTKFTAVIYPGPDGPALAVLPSCRGGLTTPHTPAGVSFYLDQAHKAQSVGANSAATAMFRGALEHLLFQQGYQTGMLGGKIDQLCKDIVAGKAPQWARDLETDFLLVLKDLGNGSIHPNDGDVGKQAQLDNGLLARVKQTFLMLLFLVYEVPHSKAEMLDELRAKAQALKK